MQQMRFLLLLLLLIPISMIGSLCLCVSTLLLPLCSSVNTAATVHALKHC
jgi:hypothetical protein